MVNDRPNNRQEHHAPQDEQVKLPRILFGGVAVSDKGGDTAAGGEGFHPRMIRHQAVARERGNWGNSSRR